MSARPSAPPEPALTPRFRALEVLVFVAGASVMALEIVASRLLAPHFGSSVFMWGSLISVVMTALSVGYLVGGRLADRFPSFVMLNVILLVAALLVAVVPWVGHPFCRVLLDLGLREQAGPLVAACVLFLPASVALGMVSPFAVRLAARDLASLGRKAGTLYALSTIGSIAGTLLTTFVLIPHVNVGTIFKGLAAAMILLPLVVLLGRFADAKRTAPLLVVALAALALPTSPAAEPNPGTVVRLEEETPYHRIAVLDWTTAGVRLLKFDRYVESSMELEPPHRSLSEYTDYFHLAFLVAPDLRRVAFIGAGGGLGPRAFLLAQPEASIDVVDVDQRVLEIAEEYFHMPRGPQIRPVARDGRMFVQLADEPWDCIVLDAFTIGGRIPFHLATREAFASSRDHLTEDGVFIMNINSALTGPKSEIFRAIARTLSDVFPTVHAFAVGHGADRSDDASRNVIFVATREPNPLSPADWRARVATYPPRGLISRPRMREMVADLIPLPDLSDVQPLTDELTPIETMGF